ncbi:PD-(D/E)XK nuclease family protein [uncultured Gemella sp.]|uniref:PD-(D/E)XK nuclease family protein n=1 Tax=uncultured Gemella sp. TaxID=254352 RepID=UPI0026347E34|nr:PD-(D/E)XK nuclease family protein [uncultured Gemella sp.]
MGNYNELLTLRKKIENTLNYQLSLSNLELYHSNLFAVVLEKSGFINHHFFSEIIDINKKYTDLKVYREKNSIDLTIEVTDEDGQTHVIFIENKVKSLPDKSQLIRYSEKDSNAKGILLSLVKPGFDLPGSWFRRSYVELIEYYRNLLDKVDETFRLFLTDYVEYMKNVKEFIEKISYGESYFLEECNNKVLEGMRLRSVIEKIHYANLENKISDLRYKTYSGRIRGAHHFGIDLPIEGTTSSFDIQIQGNQYRHKVNFSLEDKVKLGDLEGICDSIKEKTCLYHFNLEDNPILEKSSSRKKWKTYGKKDYYDYAHIKKHVSSEELIKYIRTDVKKIEAHLKIVKEIILENMA